MKYWLSCICTSEPMWIRENPKFRLLHPILVFLKELKMNAVQLFHPGKKNCSKKSLKDQNYHHIHAHDEFVNF